MLCEHLPYRGLRPCHFGGVTASLARGAPKEKALAIAAAVVAQDYYAGCMLGCEIYTCRSNGYCCATALTPCMLTSMAGMPSRTLAWMLAKATLASCRARLSVETAASPRAATSKADRTSVRDTSGNWEQSCARQASAC